MRRHHGAVFRRMRIGKLLEAGREKGKPARKPHMPLLPAGCRGPKCAAKTGFWLSAFLFWRQDITDPRMASNLQCSKR